MRPEGLPKKNSNDTIGNRTRDLPACSAVPQPTAPPRATLNTLTVTNVLDVLPTPNQLDSKTVDQLLIKRSISHCNSSFYDASPVFGLWPPRSPSSKILFLDVTSCFRMWMKPTVYLFPHTCRVSHGPSSSETTSLYF